MSFSHKKTGLFLMSGLIIGAIAALFPKTPSRVSDFPVQAVIQKAQAATRNARPQLIWQQTELTPVNAIAFSPDGRFLASARERGEVQLAARHAVKLWDVQTGELKSTLVFNGSLNCLEFSRDGKMLLGADGRRVVLWDLKSTKIIREWLRPDGWAETVKFSPDGKIIACGGYDTVRLLDVASGKEKRVLKYPQPQKPTSQDRYYANDLAFSTNGKKLAVAYRYTGAIGLWDLSSGQLQLLQSEPSAFYKTQFRTVAFSPDGQTLIGGGGSHVFIDIGKLPEQGRLYLWNADQPSKSAPKIIKAHQFEVLNMALSPDSKTLVSGDEEGYVVLHEMQSGKKRHILRGREEKGNGYWQRDINDVAVSPDGAFVAACDERGIVKLWRL